MEALLFILIPILLGVAIFSWYAIDTNGEDFAEFGGFENWILRKLRLGGMSSSAQAGSGIVGKKGKVLNDFTEADSSFSGKVQVAGEIFTAEAKECL